MFPFYKAPLDPQNIKEDKSERCNIGDSISQHLMVILSTRLGEIPSLPDFGCKVWDYQFELLYRSHDYIIDITKNLELTVKKYEKRLLDPIVHIELSEVEVNRTFRKYPDAKKKMNIKINAIMGDTKEPFFFKTSLFLSPISK